MLALLIRWYGENHDPVILCDLTEVWLGEGKHTETTEMLEAFCLSGGVFGSQEFKNAARQREHRGLRYILSRVFPPSSEVKEYYSNASGEKHSLVYYYVKRWLGWFQRRKELKKQQMKILLAGNMSKYVVHIIAADS